MTDIDIDFFDRKKALENLRYVLAVEVHGNQRRKHLSGIYFHDIPVDPVDNMAVWEYKTAEQKGYFKVDFLHNTIYEKVRNEDHLVDLLVREPPWDVFNDEDIVNNLSHLAGHFDVVKKIQPKNIEDLAVCIALTRPGKIYLQKKPRAEIDKEIWIKTEKYYFKKSHAISYASAIIVQLNLLIEETMNV